MAPRSPAPTRSERPRSAGLAGTVALHPQDGRERVPPVGAAGAWQTFTAPPFAETHVQLGGQSAAAGSQKLVQYIEPPKLPHRPEAHIELSVQVSVPGVQTLTLPTAVHIQPTGQLPALQSVVQYVLEPCVAQIPLTQSSFVVHGPPTSDPGEQAPHAVEPPSAAQEYPLGQLLTPPGTHGSVQMGEPVELTLAQ